MNKTCSKGHDMVAVDLPQFTELVWYCPVEGCEAGEGRIGNDESWRQGPGH